MRHLTASLLLDAPLVRVTDVACHAPRCGPGVEEGASAGVELVLPRRGVFCVHRGSAAIAADPNSVLTLGRGEEYRVSHPAHGGDECTSLVFAPELIEEALGRVPAHHALTTPPAQLRAGMLAATLTGKRLSRLAAEEAALALLADLAPSLSPAAAPGPVVPGPALRRVQRVQTLLAAEPATAWTLDHIAQAVHCSPLARQFRAATGETIARYLLRLRLAVALQRIGAGESALGRLAVELGFAHHSHFTARFRAVFGLTPSEARKIVTAGGASTP